MLRRQAQELSNGVRTIFLEARGEPYIDPDQTGVSTHVIPTSVGYLRASEYILRDQRENPRMRLISVFFRFDEPDKAWTGMMGDHPKELGCGLNPYSGKYNFHAGISVRLDGSVLTTILDKLRGHLARVPGLEHLRKEV